MISVGITGGIGSGKSTVARIWESLGAEVVFADDLAKELMRTDPVLRQKLKDTFGKKTYNPDGSLNKPHLIKEAFQKNRVKELNSIVHPAMRIEIQNLITQADKTGAELFAYEAAILLNNGRPDYLDLVVLVTSDRNSRLARVSERDSVNEEEVAARMGKQPDFATLTHLADYIINNNGTLDELREKSVNLYQELIGNH